MRRILLALKDWFLSLWVGKPIEMAAATKKRQVKQRVEKQHFGAHYYLSDLLDQMDKTFDDMELVRKFDKDVYDMARHLGASVQSSEGVLATGKLEPVFMERLPAFGCSHLGGSDPEDKEFMGISFIAFIKEKKPMNVQPLSGHIYRVIVTYQDKKKCICEQFFVSVEDYGVYPLKECKPQFHSVGSGNNKAHFSRMSWRYPFVLRQIADENKRRGERQTDTPEKVAEFLFIVAASSALQPESGLTVRVSKGSKSLKFAVDPLRTPYFFADREKVSNEKGNTKRILHIVKTHARSDGTIVKSHWRGLRNFRWNGYDVNIGMGGKHVENLSLFDAHAIDESSEDATGSKTVGLSYTLKFLRSNEDIQGPHH